MSKLDMSARSRTPVEPKVLEPRPGGWEPLGDTGIEIRSVTPHRWLARTIVQPGSGDEPYAADGTFATEAVANLAWSLSIVARRLQNALEARESGSSQDHPPEIPEGYMMRIEDAVARAEAAANYAEHAANRAEDAAHHRKGDRMT